MPYKNREDRNAWQRAYRKRNWDLVYACEKSSIAKKKPFYRAKWRKPTRRLADYYVRQQLSQQRPEVARREWHPWVVELKRKQLLLKREGDKP